jgi:hypothetical protein
MSIIGEAFIGGVLAGAGVLWGVRVLTQHGWSIFTRPAAAFDCFASFLCAAMAVVVGPMQAMILAGASITVSCGLRMLKNKDGQTLLAW